MELTALHKNIDFAKLKDWDEADEKEDDDDVEEDDDSDDDEGVDWESD